MSALFLAWQDPISRSWFPIGRLTFDRGVYQFAYTHGARTAQEQARFQLLPSFPSLNKVYESNELFPLFSNRLPSRSRVDYEQFVEWLNLPLYEDDPVALLARSAGRRATDTFEVFPCPERTEEGAYHIHFFAHGLRHLSQHSIERVARLQAGEPLLLVHDFQNPHGPNALMLRTNGRDTTDIQIVGYCPRYLVGDFLRVIVDDPGSLSVKVERLNPPPAPLAHRLLCNMTAQWPAEFKPFDGPDYQPLVMDAATPAG